MPFPTQQNRPIDYFPLAIVGVSCYLPDAESPSDFWSNLFQGKVSVRDVCEDRFPSEYYDTKKQRGKSYSRLAALIDYERFCLEIVPKMEKAYTASGKTGSLLPMAPGHLLALHTAMETLRSAGLDPFQLTDPSVGLFCGLVSANNSAEFSSDFSNTECFLDHLNEIPSFSSLSSDEIRSIKKEFLTPSPPPNDFCMRRPEFFSRDGSHRLIRLIQESFGLTAPGFCFDSACSSSLLALEVARNYLAQGKINAALVGGMTFFSSSGPIHFSNASSCSAQGTWPFDHRANGLVAGEGCVFSLIKGLDQAIRDGDEILGIVQGIGFSTDGRGKSLWAPSSAGQSLAIRRAFQNAGYTSWDDFDYVEAHATSTPLGDATELISLTQAMKDNISPDKKLPITSLKSTIGHLLEAAGMTSLLKILLSMKNEIILGQTGLEKLCDKFDWSQSNLFVPTENRPWSLTDRPRRAMVQAFGIGGLNTQVMLEGPESKNESSISHTDSLQKNVSPIAIVGMGCVFPEAFNVPAFQRLLDNGRTAFTSIPIDRKDLFSPRSNGKNRIHYFSSFVVDSSPDMNMIGVGIGFRRSMLNTPIHCSLWFLGQSMKRFIRRDTAHGSTNLPTMTWQPKKFSMPSQLP